MSVRCYWCGRFISGKTAVVHFVPDNEFGPEELWWECRGECAKSVRNEKKVEIPNENKQG